MLVQANANITCPQTFLQVQTCLQSLTAAVVMWPSKGATFITLWLFTHTHLLVLLRDSGGSRAEKVWTGLHQSAWTHTKMMLIWQKSVSMENDTKMNMWQSSGVCHSEQCVSVYVLFCCVSDCCCTRLLFWLLSGQSERVGCFHWTLSWEELCLQTYSLLKTIIITMVIIDEYWWVTCFTWGLYYEAGFAISDVTSG